MSGPSRYTWALALVALSCPVAAEPLSEFQTWTSVAVSGPLRGAWRYAADVHLRFGDDSSRYSQGIVRPGVGYALSDETSLWAGYAYIESEAPFAAQPTDEHRLWQQLSWTQPTPLGLFTSRTRLEQRNLETGDDTGWRLRQSLRLAHPLARVPRTSVVTWNEIFFHLNDTDWGVETGMDQNRLFIGLGHELAAHLRGEAGYLNFYQHRPRDADRLNHLLWLSLAFQF
ncbi:MAG: DUF2490 domain-containing protein [Gammaproteobacteria bacterium]